MMKRITGGMIANTIALSISTSFIFAPLISEKSFTITVSKAVFCKSRKGRRKSDQAAVIAYKPTTMMIDFEKDGTGKIYSYDLPTDEKIVIDNFSIELSEDDPLSFTFLHENYTKEPYYMNPASELIFLPGKVIPRSAFSRKADIVGQWQTKEKTSYYYFLKDGEALYVNEDIRAYRAFTYTIDKEGRRGLIDTGSSSSTYFIIIGKWLAWSNIENEINEARILTKQ
jgi:hypothetical protein